MLWIGGAPGAGKSTLAWLLSRAADLPLHPVDLWGRSPG
jgi:adenylate kinase family enzyme